MDINDIGMGGESLSKKWRHAVKNGLFEGSFKEFADLYNQKIDDEGDSTYADDAASASDLAPVDINSKQGKILGMTPKTLIVVSTLVVVVVGTGLFLFVRSGNKSEA